MPLYTYKRESTQEYKDVFQGMNDAHEYKGENGDEEDWKRVFHIPQMSVSMNINPYDNNAFIEKTGKQKGSVGDLLDQSAELSEKRAAENGGVDPVKEKYYKDYSKKRNGAIHQNKKSKTIDNDVVKVEY